MKNISGYTLISAGNKNIPAMINAISQAAIQLQKDLQNETQSFSEVHIFHTEKSSAALFTSNLPWRSELANFHISHASLVHIDRISLAANRSSQVKKPAYSHPSYTDYHSD